MLCFASLAALATISAAQYTNAPQNATAPLVQRCGPPGVVCVNKYASVMPYPFSRPSSYGNNDYDFKTTSVPNDTSFGLLNGTNFVVFDKKRGLEILGANPTYEQVFNISTTVHEAPIYVPTQNKLYFSQLYSPPNYLPQLVIDLNANPPTLGEFEPNPPILGPNGGTYHNGLMYFASSADNANLGGVEQHVAIHTVDPATNKSNVILNNYFGNSFNTIDDLFVAADGSIWFTDPQYSYFNNESPPPQLKTASYRFDPATGVVTMVDDTLVQPNGIAGSPDGKHVYISDTGAETGNILPAGVRNPGTPYNQTGPRTVYKYDVIDGGRAIVGRRPIWYAADWIPDGLKVAANGYVVTGTGYGVDVLDEYGVLILRVQTSFPSVNFAWAGKNLMELWIVGQGGVAKVDWNLKGQDLSKASS